MGAFFARLFGSEPAHAPGISDAERAQLRRMEEECESTREEIRKSREKHEEDTAKREEDIARLASQVEATRKEAERQEKEEEALKNYPRSAFLGPPSLKANVIGASGAGKSSWLNAIRGLKATDAGAAPVGSAETTMEPTPYKWKTFVDTQVKDETVEVKIVFWDLPGGGTPRFPLKTYLRDMSLRHFDAAVAVTAERFTEVDNAIFGELQEYSIPYFPVRTKFDLAVTDGMEDHDRDEQDTKSVLQNYFIRVFDELNLTVKKVYFVSKKRGMYDGTELEEDLKKQLVLGRRLQDRYLSVKDLIF